jgi:carbon storage regulator
MLVFSRKIGQVFLVGQDIRITVVRVDRPGGDDPVVKIGIEAPPSVRVDRLEVRERILAALAADGN